MLPEDHPERVALRLGLAISALEREDSGAATAILEAYMDDEEERISKVSMSHNCQCPSPTRCHMPVSSWRAGQRCGGGLPFDTCVKAG